MGGRVNILRPTRSSAEQFLLHECDLCCRSTSSENGRSAVGRGAPQRLPDQAQSISAPSVSAHLRAATAPRQAHLCTTLAAILVCSRATGRSRGQADWLGAAEREELRGGGNSFCLATLPFPLREAPPLSVRPVLPDPPRPRPLRRCLRGVERGWAWLRPFWRRRRRTTITASHII